jgi:hypothetical protein
MLEQLSFLAELPSVSQLPPELIWSTLGLTFLSFSHRTRKRMLERDQHCCQVCGATDHLEAAHYDHSHRNTYYNSIKNGRILCTQHHLEDHLQRAGRNGLSTHHNNFAIESLIGRLVEQQQ